MPFNIEILPRDEYEERRDKEIRSAHASGAGFRVPRVIRWFGKKVVVFRGLPGEFEVDTDKDTFR